MIYDKLKPTLKSFCRHKRGTMAIMMGLALPAMIGVMGLGVDVTGWYLSKRQLQTAADSAAIAGALTYSYTSDTGAATTDAQDSASRNGFETETGNSFTINVPPATGSFAGDDGAVEVIVTELQTLYLAGVIFGKEVNVRARAVATMQLVEGEHCILALDPERAGAVEFTGTANVDVGCGVASNSHSDQSISVWGNAELDATPVSAVGDIIVGGSGELSSNAPLRSYQHPFVDPYGPQGKDLGVPALGPCDHTKLKITNATVTLNPGHYCQGLTITNANVTFNPGLYFIDRGTFSVSGTSWLYGEDVTFILTGSGTDYATVKFAGGTSADLSASTDGPFKGVLFYQDPDAPSFKGAQLIANEFLGGSTMDLAGALSFSAQEVVYTGGVSTEGSCLQIVARKITFTGNGAFGNDCPAEFDLAPIVSYRVKLVE